MQIADYDKIVLLVVDDRYASAYPRVQELVAKHGGGKVEAFIDGNGKLLPRHMYGQIRPRPVPGWQDSDGAYAHLIAIRNILQQAKSEGVRNILFLEDDVDFLPEFDEVVAKASEELRDLPPWDILYYGANHTWHRTDILSDHVLRLHGSYTTHAMGIKNHMFDAIINLPTRRVIDWMISQYIHHDYTCYGLWPNVAIQLPGMSNISNAHTDYLALFRNKGANH
jgi:hypothetical protein